MRIEGDYLVFDSGRRVYARGGKLGLTYDENEEYGINDFYVYGLGSLTHLKQKWPKEDLVELAQYMISNWQEFMERITDEDL